MAQKTPPPGGVVADIGSPTSVRWPKSCMEKERERKERKEVPSTATASPLWGGNGAPESQERGGACTHTGHSSPRGAGGATAPLGGQGESWPTACEEGRLEKDVTGSHIEDRRALTQSVLVSCGSSLHRSRFPQCTKADQTRHHPPPFLLACGSQTEPWAWNVKGCDAGRPVHSLLHSSSGWPPPGQL